MESETVVEMKNPDINRKWQKKAKQKLAELAEEHKKRDGPGFSTDVNWKIADI